VFDGPLPGKLIWDVLQSLVIIDVTQRVDGFCGVILWFASLYRFGGWHDERRQCAHCLRGSGVAAAVRG
jgi:hypothetical protein